MQTCADIVTEFTPSLQLESRVQLEQASMGLAGVWHSPVGTPLPPPDVSHMPSTDPTSISSSSSSSDVGGALLPCYARAPAGFFHDPAMYTHSPNGASAPAMFIHPVLDADAVLFINSWLSTCLTAQRMETPCGSSRIRVSLVGLVRFWPLAGRTQFTCSLTALGDGLQLEA